MENTKKDLKIISILILALSVSSFIMVFLRLIFDNFNVDGIAGASESIILIAKIVLCVLGAIILIPQLYVSIKGLKIAKDVDNYSKAVVVWAIILAVVASVALLSQISALTKGTDIVLNVVSLVNRALDVFVYIYFVICVKKTVKAA